MSKNTEMSTTVAPRRRLSLGARGAIFAGLTAIAAFAVSTSASPAHAACNGGIQCERQFETGYTPTPGPVLRAAPPVQMRVSPAAGADAPSRVMCASGIQCERYFETGYGHTQR